ncbi:MAG TPA: glycosyl hydrolase family 28-related protein [Candidatus Sulfotelmatobacter sp.]|nr:glycosyl hydrolase family 28-related protein [Candidatus Sulfotelmatobacter sp.]
MTRNVNIRRISLAAAIFAMWTALAPAPAHAQGSRKDDIVFGPSGHPVAGATITVCTATATGTPCSPLAVLYTDATLTVPAPNPFQGDGIGNYHFYAPAGRYVVQITGPGITGTINYPDVILPADLSSSGSGNNISAFGLTLGGNLTVGGNATISGTLTTTNFSPGNFTPTSLSVLGNESVQGPRPRVDVTAYGAKGDGVTDDTAAIQSAINQACSAGGSLYFPPGSYAVTQTQLPSTAAIFTPNCAIHILGGNSLTPGAGQFGSAPGVKVTVTTLGTSPNTAPVFQFTHNESTIENMAVNGHNQAIAFGSSAAATSNLRARNVTASVSTTGQANNCPYYLTATLFDTFEGSGGQAATNGYIWCFVDTSSAQPVGLVNISGNYANALVGCVLSYTSTVNSSASGPGAWDLSDLTTEACNSDLISLQNGGNSVPQITNITLKNILGSDSSCNSSNCGVVGINASGTLVAGLVIENVSTGQGGPAIRLVAGSLGAYQILGEGSVGTGRALDTSGNPQGLGFQTNGNYGLDFFSNPSDTTRLNDNLNINGTISTPPTRWCADGNVMCGLAADSAAGFLFGDQANYGYSAGIEQDSQGRLNIEFASVMPPTSLNGTLTSGGSLAPGTALFYTIRSSSGNCAANTQSAPSLIFGPITPTSGNQSVVLTWTLPPAGTSSVNQYCITRGTSGSGNSSVVNQSAYLSTGNGTGSTTSFTDTGATMGGGVNTLANSFSATHRFTPTSLGINTTTPGFNLDVNGSAAVNSLNGVPKAERFTGADAAAKINACLTAASTTSSVCDAHGLTGSLTGAAHIAIPAGTTLLWGQAQLTITDNTTNDAIELLGDGSSLYGYQESGLGTVSVPDNSGFIACATTGCTTVRNPNQATSKINYVHIFGMYLQATGASSKVIDLTSIGHSVIESNNLALGTGGNSYGIFGDTSVGDLDGTNTLIRHNNAGLNSTGDTCFSLAGIYNALVMEQNVCTLAPAATSGYVIKKDSNGNYPNNDEIYGNDCEASSAAFGQICYNVIGALSITFGPNNRCEKVYNCLQFPTDGSANGIHVLDPYLSLSNTNQVNPNEPATATVAIDNNGHNWLPSMHYGMNDLAGPNLLGNSGFEGWQNSTTLFYWGGASGTNINQAGSGIYLQETSAGSNPGVDTYTQGSYNVRVGDGATAGLGVNSACIQVDATREYTLMFRVASGSTSNNFRPGFRFYWDPNCTEADRITSASANARVLAPANYAGTSTSTGNWQSTNASLTYNNGITCNCNVTGADWQVAAANTWTPTRNFGIIFRVPNAYSVSTTVTHSMRVFLLENTAAANNYVYFDDAILSQGPVSVDIQRPAPLADSGPGGTVNGYANYNFAGTVSLQSNTANVGTFSHSITANRTWTLPDTAGNVVVQTGSTPANNDCAQFSVSGSTVSIKDSGGACSSPAALASWGLQHAGSGQSFSSNAVKVWGVIIPYAVSYSHIDYDVSTLDSSTSDDYDLGLYGPCAVNTSSCALVTHIGAQNLTSTGYKQASVTSGTLQPGLYWIAMTGNATTAQLATTSVSEWTVCPSTNSSTTSSGGALPSTIATPNCTAPQWTGAAVLSIGFE